MKKSQKDKFVKKDDTVKTTVVQIKQKMTAHKHKGKERKILRYSKTFIEENFNTSRRLQKRIALDIINQAWKTKIIEMD